MKLGLCSKRRDAALAGMAVKLVQLESLVEAKQAEQQAMGYTGQAWISTNKNKSNHSYVYTANGAMLLWLEWQ